MNPSEVMTLRAASESQERGFPQAVILRLTLDAQPVDRSFSLLVGG